jgi:hypothetical protein
VHTDNTLHTKSKIFKLPTERASWPALGGYQAGTSPGQELEVELMELIIASYKGYTNLNILGVLTPISMHNFPPTPTPQDLGRFDS